MFSYFGEGNVKEYTGDGWIIQRTICDENLELSKSSEYYKQVVLPYLQKDGEGKGAWPSPDCRSY